jgi:acetyltransferase
MKLDVIFNPKSIAVIGASTEIGSVGNDIAKNLTTGKHTAKIFLINPKTTELYGFPCYPTVSAVPEKIDLAIIIVPASIVPKVLEEAAQKGAKGAVVISAGFKEISREDLEDELKKISKKYDIALIGPNCLGIINTDNHLNASFSPVMPDPGKITFISQSGAMGTAILDYAKKLNLGFSKFISVGNKAVVDELELLRYLADDDNTKVIALYIEQLKNAPALIELAKKITSGHNPKPIIAIKAGRTEAGAHASASHTGALAGNDSAYNALFRQAGIVRVNTMVELFEHLRVFSHNPLPKGNRVAIITNAGGPGVLTTDECIAHGLQLAVINLKTEMALKKILPPSANWHNPIDVLGDARSDRYHHTLKILINDPDIDSLIVVLTPQSMTDEKKIAEAIIEIKQSVKKPIVVSFIGGKMVTEAVNTLQNAGIATVNFPEQGARALAALTRFAENTRPVKTREINFKNIDKKKVRQIFDAAKPTGKTAFPEAEAIRILSAYNFPLVKSRPVQNPAEIKEAVKYVGGLATIKIISPDILHKSEVGGIILNVTPENAEKKFVELYDTVHKHAPKAILEGALISEMIIVPGTEFILGANRETSLGTMIMVGLGGIYVEVFKDVAFGINPLTLENIKEMVEQLKSQKIIHGTRGKKPLDQEALITCVARLSQLLTDFPEIKELDINPLLVTEKGVAVLDARIIID